MCYEIINNSLQQYDVAQNLIKQLLGLILIPKIQELYVPPLRFNIPTKPKTVAQIRKEKKEQLEAQELLDKQNKKDEEFEDELDVSSEEIEAVITENELQVKVKKKRQIQDESDEEEVEPVYNGFESADQDVTMDNVEEESEEEQNEEEEET